MTVSRRDLLAAFSGATLPAAFSGATLPAAFGGATLFSARAGAATPLRLVDDRIFVAARVNGRATSALLDSAAEMTVLDRAFADALGLRGGRPVTASGTGTATASARLIGGVELAIAGLVLRPKTVAVIDLADIARRLNHDRIDVIAGRDLFDAARLAIDVAAGALHVVPRDRPPAGRRLPLTRRRGIEAVPMTIEGRPALADFDLGNGGSVLVGAAYARRHGLLDGRLLESIPGGGIGGETRQTSFTLASLDLAGRRFVDVPAAVDASLSAADANIGVRLLRNFGIVTDFAQRAIWLDPRG